MHEHTILDQRSVICHFHVCKLSIRLALSFLHPFRGNLPYDIAQSSVIIQFSLDLGYPKLKRGRNMHTSYSHLINTNL